MTDEKTCPTGGAADPACHPDARWPVRTQRLLGELRGLCGNWLHEPLRRSLDHFDMSLHRQSELTGSHLEQQQYLTTRLQLRTERQAFDRRFIASIEQAFDRLGLPIQKAAAAVPQTLSLLDPLEHELAAALDQLVARSETRGGPQFVELGYRFAVLIGAPPLKSEALPVGPQAMANAFREASRTLGLPCVHELLLLQSLESSLIQGLAPLYGLVNAHLCADGILPRLRPFALPRAAPRQARKEAPVAPTVAARSEVTATPDDRNGARAGGGGSSTESSAITDEELQGALAMLQAHLSEADEQTRLDLNRPQRLREELLIQLNVGRASQAMRASLSGEQDDTVELIVRLFGQIVQQLPATSDAQTLLWDLQLPMLRMALIDRGFSEQHEHPARKVLGRIAEIARDWLDDAGEATDRGLRLKLGELLERTRREPPSAALYVSLQGDIEQYLAYLQHKTQLAERRQVDAMQGLERLEQARHRVGELLSPRLSRAARGKHHPDERLAPAWSDVLALTLLRHGEQSQIFGTRLAVTDQLLGSLPIGDRHKLQYEVENGLRQIGMPGDEAAKMAARMMDADRVELADKASSGAPVMQAGLRRPEESFPEANDRRAEDVPAEAARSPAVTAPGPDVLRIHRHLRALPPGVWFEFVDPAGGRGVRRRLVWYSPLTGHSLFVTRSGQRAEELGELQLAHEIARGHVHEIASDHEDVLDHAWRTVTRELSRQPSRRGTTHE